MNQQTTIVRGSCVHIKNFNECSLAYPNYVITIFVFTIAFKWNA